MTGGFFAKFYVFSAAVKANLIWLTLIGVVNSAIGAYYYLRIIKTMFFDEPVDRSPIQGDVATAVLLALNGLAMLGFGLLPDGLMTVCRDAVVKAFNT